MKNISDEVISVEEARAALRCMRLCSFDETEALESVESLVHRIRKVGTARLVEEIIEKKLSETQKHFIKEFWFNEKNTAQIARENCVSQANVYRTISRANETIKEFITPLVMYHNDLVITEIEPLYFREIMNITSASERKGISLSEQLKYIRLSNAVTSEQLAKAVCITVGELEKIENGKKLPSLEILERYSRIFNVEINLKFINGKGRYEWKKA
ncbi:MAG: transcriptional regulator [Clostridia bacterium]|nr:transcriptional regulator [Clostridia bacterium]